MFCSRILINAMPECLDVFPAALDPVDGSLWPLSHLSHYVNLINLATIKHYYYVDMSSFQYIFL